MHLGQALNGCSQSITHTYPWAVLGSFFINGTTHALKEANMIPLPTVDTRTDPNERVPRD